MADRVLLLVRHAQYHVQDTHESYGRLTPLGERQAKRAARRLASYPVDVVYSSTLPRAVETANLIGARLGKVPTKRSHLLREGIPTPFRGITAEQRARMASSRARMERAFNRYFRPTRGSERYEVLVCHGNIIRYLLRRATGDAPSRWWRFAVMHCGLSIVLVRPNGAAHLMTLNDVGHLPRTMQTLA